jgi:hypothetical protein
MNDVLPGDVFVYSNDVILIIAVEQTFIHYMNVQCSGQTEVYKIVHERAIGYMADAKIRDGAWRTLVSGLGF